MFKLLPIFFLLFSCAHKAQKASTLEGLTYKSGPIKHEFKTSTATVVVFISAYCPCSNSHIPVIKDLKQQFPKFSFIAVHSNANEVKAKAKNYFLKQDLDFPVIRDHSGDIARQFGALKTPHVFVLDSQGNTIYKGGVTDSSNAKASKRNFLKMALTDITNGKAPRAATKKTLGCYIELNEVI